MGVRPDRFEPLHLQSAEREEVVAAVLREHSNLAPAWVEQMEGIAEQGEGAVWEAQVDMLVRLEVASIEVVMIFARGFLYMLPHALFTTVLVCCVPSYNGCGPTIKLNRKWSEERAEP